MAKPHSRTRAPAFSFNHLLGLKPAGARAEDKPEDKIEDKPKDDTTAEDMVDCPACDGSGEDEDGEDCDACDGEGEVSKDEAKKIKKDMKARAEDDDVEETEDEKSDDEAVRKAAKAARAFERARCAAIFADPAAAKRPDLAAHLAFNTKGSARASRDLLAAAAAGSPAAHPGRREARPRVNLGGDPAPAGRGSDPKSLAAQIVAAGKKRRGEA